MDDLRIISECRLRDDVQQDDGVAWCFVSWRGDEMELEIDLAPDGAGWDRIRVTERWDEVAQCWDPPCGEDDQVQPTDALWLACERSSAFDGVVARMQELWREEFLDRSV